MSVKTKSLKRKRSVSDVEELGDADEDAMQKKKKMKKKMYIFFLSQSTKLACEDVGRKC